jgi:multidrug efflux pump subunit AcrB
VNPRGGLIDIFARHPTAANLLMVLMIILGLFAYSRLNTQFFPNFGIDVISVSIEWPGASAEDVDSNVIQAIEPEVRYLDAVKQVRSSSLEGHATLLVEFEPGSDMQVALSDVETAVGQVTTLPENSERPVIRRLVRYDNITRLLISGPYGEAALKAQAKTIREDLLAAGIDKVDLIGVRDEEIWIEIEPATLRRLDLTLGDIAARIAETSQDMPSGDTSGGAERQIRSIGLMKSADALGDVEIRALANGEKIYLRDIATLSERFDDGGVTVRQGGQSAIEIHVQRALNADALTLADTVDDYLVGLGERLPDNISVVQYDVAADLIRSRLNLLLYNGAGGLVLVVVILFVFLNMRVAFWVAVGIPVSLLATMVAMLATGQSINMVSLFGLIMALGIIVDDAIVVGEHAEARFRAGMAPLDAAEAGAKRMAAPVLCASLTTIAAFVPLLVISDIIGEIISAIPFVVIAVIIASLVESFLILPGHLRGALGHVGDTPSRPRQWFNDHFDSFRDGTFRRLVSVSLRWRYVTVATALAAFILCIGLVVGGRIGFVFFPSPEVDWVYANVEMVAGTPRGDTEAMIDELERSLKATEAALTGGDGELVNLSVGKIGSSVGRGVVGIPGDHMGGVIVELVPTDERHVASPDFIAAWRAEVAALPGLETLTIVAARGGPPGREIDVRLSGSDAASLKAAASEVKGLLARYPGVSDIEDDLPFGKQETILEVNTRGRAMGFNTQIVGRQVRNAFEGAIAKRFPRGDEEVLVRVQYPRSAVGATALDNLYLRGPTGAEVPLGDVVDRRDSRGFARIKRENGSRQVSVIAEIDKQVTSNDEILTALERDGLADIARRHNVTASFAGKSEEQATTLGDMRAGAMVGLAAIYLILAWVFASYTRPLVVMSVIPLGFVGAAIGHLFMGYDLTVLSLIALIGLSGIVVNDSIILVTSIDGRLRAGEALMDAITAGSQDRLRAVILTSATTIGGLTPLMFETSLQAQFLMPMAITITFGLAVATLLVLIVVPALIAIQGDFGRIIKRFSPARNATSAAPGQ